MSQQPRHIVVIGHGMVGHRFVDEVARRDPDGQHTRLTVVGAETEGPYNRILLPELVNGRLAEADLALPETTRPNLTVRAGNSATAVDPHARRVTLDDGSHLDYDELVLATGARAVLPPLPGATTDTGKPASGVTALRDLADSRRLASLVRPGAPVVVLGGGVLGLEAARALSQLGARVSVVESSAWLMRRQLDQDAARVLRGHYARLGITVYSWRVAVRWHPGTGLELDDGRMLAADALVVTAGVRPRTELAADAGLAVEHAVVVDDSLGTSHPRVHAIGDCAQHPGGGGGLVQPGFEQASVLADLLTGTAPQARYTGARPATRLKADGIDLVSLGSPNDDEDTETATVNDAHSGRYAKLAVRDGRVAGAILLGFPEAAATIGQLYDHGSPVPEDRLALLLGGLLPDAEPEIAAEESTVCHCNGVSRAQLEEAWLDGARTRAAVADATRATTGCGGCTRDVNALLSAWNDGQPTPASA